MEKLAYVPTCYEQVIIDLKENPTAELKMSDYPEFKRRGHTKKQFEAWVTHSKFSLYLTKFGGKDNDKKAYQQALCDYVKAPNFINEETLFDVAVKIGRIDDWNEISLDKLTPIEIAAASCKIPMYKLLPEELKILKEAEKIGRGKDVILNYKDKFGKKQAYCHPYLDYPVNEGDRTDVFVIFSGHQQTGTKFVEFFYSYMLNYFFKMEELTERIRKTQDFQEAVVLGLELKVMNFFIASCGLTDNQGLTDWDSSFFFRKMHEYYMYFAHANYGGIPKSITNKLLMYDVKDTDTAQNAVFLEDTLKHYHLDNVNLIFIGYPVYQMRTLTEMAKYFSKSDVNVNIRLADIPTKKFDTKSDLIGSYDYRMLSYDKLDMQGFDLISNCVSNLYREKKGKTAKRFQLPGKKYAKFPKELKPLIQLALGYSYKNIPHELCSTEETVALALKLNRSLMLKTHDQGYSGKVQEKQQQYYADEINKMLIDSGCLSEELIQKANTISEVDYLQELYKLFCKSGVM